MDRHENNLIANFFAKPLLMIILVFAEIKFFWFSKKKVKSILNTLCRIDAEGGGNETKA